MRALMSEGRIHCDYRIEEDLKAPSLSRGKKDRQGKSRKKGASNTAKQPEIQEEGEEHAEETVS